MNIVPGEIEPATRADKDQLTYNNNNRTLTMRDKPDNRLIGTPDSIRFPAV